MGIDDHSRGEWIFGPMPRVGRRGDHPCMATNVDMRNDGSLPVTPATYRKLEQELDLLRLESIDAGDEAPMIEARISRVAEILARAEIVDVKTSDGTVMIGSGVTLLDHESGRTEGYLIDGAHGELDSNLISAVSPMGTALIGSERGAIVDVELPTGRVRTFTLLDVAEPA
jgi:transcription elongation GreA/GreB family factor